MNCEQYYHLEQLTKRMSGMTKEKLKFKPTISTKLEKRCKWWKRYKDKQRSKFLEKLILKD